MVTTQAAQQLLSASPSPEVVGYQGESWGCKYFVFCSVFIVGKQQSCAVGALAICTDLVAQEVTNPAESAFTCPGASLGAPRCCALFSCLAHSKPVPRVYSCPTAEAGWSLLWAVAFAKPVVPSLAHVKQTYMHHVCPAAHSMPHIFLLPFSLHFVCVFAEENYPFWELEEMQRMK